MDAIAAYSRVSEQSDTALIKAHAALVKRIAYHLLARLPRNVLLDDLLQAGMLGLLDALRHFDGNKGASFETYASIRIRGQMIDELRRNDWVPRQVHKNARTIAEVVNKLENQLGREAKDSEIAQEMQLGLEEYHAILMESVGAQVIGFEDLPGGEDYLKAENPIQTPQDEVMDERFSAHLAQIIETLPEREQLVLSLYYEQSLNLKEIGEVLGVSESRVSQLHTQATLRIRARLGNDK